MVGVKYFTFSFVCISACLVTRFKSEDSKPGPVFTKGLSQGLDLKLRLLSQVSFGLGLVVFTKNLRLVLSLAKGSTLRLVGSGLKFCKEDLNMAAINFSPLQNLKWP